MDKSVYRCLVELAREHGWEGSALWAPENFFWLLIDDQEREVDSHDEKNDHWYAVVTIAHAIKILKKAPPEQPIMIGERVVEFKDDGSIMIRSLREHNLRINKKTIEAIYRKVNR